MNSLFKLPKLNFSFYIFLLSTSNVHKHTLLLCAAINEVSELLKNFIAFVANPGSLVLHNGLNSPVKWYTYNAPSSKPPNDANYNSLGLKSIDATSTWWYSYAFNNLSS